MITDGPELTAPVPFLTQEEAIYVGNSALRLKQLRSLTENTLAGALEISQVDRPHTKLTLSQVEAEAILGLLMEREEIVLSSYGIETA